MNQDVDTCDLINVVNPRLNDYVLVNDGKLCKYDGQVW